MARSIPSFIPDFDTLVNNIVNIYSEAKHYEHVVGKHWYYKAHLFCSSIAKEFTDLGLPNLTDSRTAYALAALSPRNSWENNKRDLRFVLHSLLPHHAQLQSDVDDFAHYRGFAFLPNIEKARAILTQPAHTELSELLKLVGKGAKTLAFAKLCSNVVIEDDTCIVCIDTHAISTAIGKRVFAGESNKVFNNPVASEHLARAYRAATVQINLVYHQSLEPYQVQAITWVTWKRLNNI
jgi:hypothetical protein